MRVSNDILMPQLLALVAEGHTVTITARGNSMRPLLVHERDKIVIGRLQDTVSVGDVVLALLSTGNYVLHRVVDIQGDAVTLLGDGNLSPEHCRLSCIKARAVAFVRGSNDTPLHLSSRSYRIYSWCWMHLRPLRRYLLFALSRLGISPVKQLN